MAEDHDIYDIYERTFEFACRVQRMNQTLAQNRQVNRNAMKQLVDASSSIGANLQEAKAGQSKADFHSKLRIALKEARESHYWLRLIGRSGAVSAARIAPLTQEANEIVAVLTTIAKKANPHNPADPDS